ncbi:NF038130 family PEP-CTERM protein [aff. Roholtiella sp. LEGE 12411]|uniref:NF038130 family PEP-CTERM protein n=1 Tax=aff. Roholtiella sp. LEGE 12411 TaxID=1828822 RepID=UPI001882A01D|nr:NF038130 family PEP-CTERM protein [aff. Roholtiella sp. LEGE 12411]MBE9035545.1 NF038130 family PEP-CTERM protein [aff. Roholtiella sp. LEGE 12411]
MKMNFEKLVIGASIAIGVSAIATVPAQAGTLTGASIGGTAATDYLVYDSNATNTFAIPNSQTNVQKVLDGSAANPTGNVELAASSEKAGFNFTKNTTLQGQIGGKDITLSSLTLSDWTSSYKGTTFGQYWFNQALTFNGLSSVVGTITGQGLFANFVNQGGFQRFSDPNISYVNQNDNTGLISIGLAGHYDAAPLLGLSSNPLRPLQASEIVKYTYNGVTDYLFSFQATRSGLTELSDGVSHSGNYQVSIQGVPPTAVPEPSVILGMLSVAGVFATQRKLKKASI